jgi:hypothetical protein
MKSCASFPLIDRDLDLARNKAFLDFPARRELGMGNSAAVPLPHPIPGVQNGLSRQLIEIDFNLGIGSVSVEEIRSYLQRLAFSEVLNRHRQI